MAVICTFNLYGQGKELKKAIRTSPSALTHTAYFKNYPVSKESNIRSWCRTNGYVVTSIKTEYKERFGSSSKKFISTVSFRSEENHFFIKNKTSAERISSYLQKYPNGIHRKDAYTILLQQISTVPMAAKYARLYPEIEDNIITVAYEKAKNRRVDQLKWLTQFLDNFPNHSKASYVEKIICISDLQFATCLDYYKKYEGLKSCTYAKAVTIVHKTKDYYQSSQFLRQFGLDYRVDKLYLKNNIWDILIENLTSLQRCKEQLAYFPEKEAEILTIAKSIAEKGEFDTKREYLKLFPKSSDYTYFKNIIDEEEERIQREKDEAEQQRLLAIKRKKEKEEADRRAKELERQRIIAEKKALIAKNNNSNTWKLGCDICKFDGSKTIVYGKLDQFNSDKSQIKVKVLMASVRNFENQTLYKEEYIWAKSKGWYYCPGEENFDLTLETKDQSIARRTREAQEAQQREIEASKPKFDFGNSVKCRKFTGNASWSGRVIDIRGDLYQIELSRVYTGKSFLSIQINANECTGNKTINSTDGKIGTEIWVPEYCIE